MRHSAKSIFGVESNRITPPIRIYIQNRLVHESGDQGYRLKKKNRGSKISWDCPFKMFKKYMHARFFLQ
jgi:hypothetical protein